MVKTDEIGDISMLQCDYIQGHLAELTKDTLRNFSHNRLRSQLVSSSDRVLEDIGFSRELLLQDVSAWVYSIFNEHEKEVRQAISELENYSDRELSDIGIVRCDIKSIVCNGHTDFVAAPNDLDLNEHQPIVA